MVLRSSRSIELWGKGVAGVAGSSNFDGPSDVGEEVRVTTTRMEHMLQRYRMAAIALVV